jgi:hypothetical protein
MSLVNSLRDAVQKRVIFVRTRNAIRDLPLETALDLDIYAGDADRIARKAVYGA